MHGLATGAAAFGSAASGGLWNGGSWRCDPSFGTSYALANFGTTIITTVGTGGLGEGGIGAKLGAGLFRKVANQGIYKSIAVLMTKRNVLQLAEKAGIGLDGIAVKIIRNPDLMGTGFMGWTDGKIIQLYPDAFQSEEQLIKTLGHERTHIYQYVTMGMPQDTEALQAYEDGAVAAEEAYWQNFLSN